MGAPNLEKTPTQDASIEPLVALVADDMVLVNEEILSRAISDVEMIPEVAGHLINSGGKRLRPMLTLAAAQMCGYGGKFHIKLAASVEFMHTATLLHDDVVDESEVRRGKAAARMVWGNEASVLVGDFLLGQAFKMMVETGSLDALAILSNAAAVIAEGEVMQLSAAQNIDAGENFYLQVINAKTAALFAAACEVGTVIAGRGTQERAALNAYGEALGITFQLIDDALDYSGEQSLLGKSVGDDFREGKMTLPVILCLKDAPEDERKFWQRCLHELEQIPADLDHALELMARHNALEETIERARFYGNQAKQALSVFDDSAHKYALIQTVDFCINRVH
jgi:octaprenyl-diphosphate synthase